MKALDKAPLSDDEISRLDAYWRAANYLTVGQIYLLDNELLAAAARARRREAPAPRSLGNQSRAST